MLTSKLAVMCYLQFVVMIKILIQIIFHVEQRHNVNIKLKFFGEYPRCFGLISKF